MLPQKDFKSSDTQGRGYHLCKKGIQPRGLHMSQWPSILKAGFHTKACSGRTNQSCWTPAPTSLDMNMEPQKLIISGIRIAFRVTPALRGSMSICHNNLTRRGLRSPSAYDLPPFPTEEASRQNHGPFLRPLHKGQQHKLAVCVPPCDQRGIPNNTNTGASQRSRGPVRHCPRKGKDRKLCKP